MVIKKDAFRPFSYGQREPELSKEIYQRVVATVHERRRRMISDENSHSYRHGREWSSSHSPATQKFSHLESASAQAAISFKDIVDHRLSAITEYIDCMADSLERSFMSILYNLIDITTEKTGNVVRGSGDSAQDFLDMLSKIETGVDRYGRPTMPSIITSPSTGQQLSRELEAQSVEFQRRVEELKAEKEKRATAHEVDRIARFRW